MPLSIREEIEISAAELQKLSAFSLSIAFPQKELLKCVKKLDKLELMILDSAMKQLDLVKLQDTILILPEPYLVMLQKVTVCLLLQLQSFISR